MGRSVFETFALEGWKIMEKWEWRYYFKRLTKKYYIINRSAGGAGFFSNYMWVLGHVIFARKLGYIPVVDMLNFPTLYSEKEGVAGEKNAWNYYFENVSGASLEEAYASGSYVMGMDMPLHKYEGKFCTGSYRFPTEKAADYYAPVIKKHMVIRKDIKEQIDQVWNNKFAVEDVVLGIHVRGTDMKNNLGHPMPATVDRYLEETRCLLNKYPEITRVFLATDECEVLERFQEAFLGLKQELFFHEAFRAKEDGALKKTGIHELKPEKERPQHKYLLGYEVLRDACFLEKCDYLLCGHSNITNVVLLWKDNAYRDVVCIGAQDGRGI